MLPQVPCMAPADVGRAPALNLLLQLQQQLTASVCCALSCHAGTIPRVDPTEELPEVDKDPPESATAGPTPGYGGGDTRPV